MLRHAEHRKQEPAVIDYFATSLPNLLVFEEDLKARRDAEADLIAALAQHGLGQREEARAHALQALDFDPSSPLALALLQQLANPS